MNLSKKEILKIDNEDLYSRIKAAKTRENWMLDMIF